MTHRPIVWAIAPKVAAVLSLCAATVLPYGADTRFGLIENGRLMPADFPPGLSNWNTSRSGLYLRHGGILELEADPHDAVKEAPPVDERPLVAVLPKPENPLHWLFSGRPMEYLG